MITTAAAAILAPIAATGVKAAPLSVDGENALLADAKTGQILFTQNADSPHAIASMTKMLVEYIIHEEIAHGNITWEKQISPSEYAVAISQNYELSNVPLATSEKYTIQELYEAMAIYSANGATIALAEAIENTEPQFVDRMNELLKSWGITDAKIYNTTGLNNEDLQGHHYPGSAADAENEMSARSMATVAYHVLNDYPEVLQVSSVPEKTFRPGTSDEIEMLNWNWMLPDLPFEYPGVDGLKTGTTNKAGANFTGTVLHNDRRLLSVIMGAGDGVENNGQRFIETRRMFDYGFEQFVAVKAVQEGQQFSEFKTIPVTDGKEREVDVVAEDGFDYLVAAATVGNESFTYEVQWNEEALESDGSVKAPFEAGTEVGKVIIHLDGEENGEGSEFIGTQSGKGEVRLVTKNSMEEAGFFLKAWNSVRNFFSRLFSRF